MATTTEALTRGALLLALLAVAGPLALPTPWGVPVTLQTLVLMTAGLLLPPARGAAVAVAYVGAGLLGLPVLAGGQAGLAVLAGPTGGYLVGFLFVPPLTALAAGPCPTRARAAAACLLGLVPVYVLGCGWSVVGHGLSPTSAMAAGFLPFLPGEAMKITAAVALSTALRGRLPIGAP